MRMEDQDAGIQESTFFQPVGGLGRCRNSGIPTLLHGNLDRLDQFCAGGIGTMELLPDGSVIAPDSGVGTGWARLVPDSTGNYLNGTWTQLANEHDSRLYDATQVLPDGRLFIAGGEYGTGRSTGEVYNPLTNTWTSLPSFPYGQFVDSGSFLLPNNEVLVSPVLPNPGGYTTIFNPSTNTWCWDRSSSGATAPTSRLSLNCPMTVSSPWTAIRPPSDIFPPAIPARAGPTPCRRSRLMARRPAARSR